jgi:hypothetical protein
MISHASSMAVLFADRVAQAPVVVQCAQAVPESWVKWLLPTIIQTIVSLASITAGVWIAVASFRANKGKEHTQWILDHKRAEWRELLKGAAEIQRVLRMESMPLVKRAHEIEDKLKHAAHELSVTSASCVFLQDFFLEPEKHAKFYLFIQEADETSESVSGLLGLYRQWNSDLTQDEKSRTIEKIMQETKQITERYLAFCEWLRKEAAISLGTVSNLPDVTLPPTTPSS